jgi:hypothetical protein
MHHRLRCKENRRERCNHCQAPHNSVSVPNSLTNPTVQKQSNDLAHNDTVTQTRLPWCWNFVRAVRKLFAILALELWKAEEVVEQTDIVTFHDDTCADQNGPANGFGVEFNALPESHVVLFFGGEASVVDNAVGGAFVVAIVGVM